jgi:hypothetical protein
VGLSVGILATFSQGFDNQRFAAEQITAYAFSKNAMASSNGFHQVFL